MASSALLLSRIWSRQMAFIIGMVMSFLGAIFILGKMSESTSNITGEGSQWKVGISSASPGIMFRYLIELEAEPGARGFIEESASTSALVNGPLAATSSSCCG